MADLDAAIRAKLELADGEENFVYDVEMVQAALFAVLDLHTSVETAPAGPSCSFCLGPQGHMDDWPCATVQAIATALGIEVP